MKGKTSLRDMSVDAHAGAAHDVDERPLLREVSPEWLAYGVRVFRSLMTGEMPLPDMDDSEDWTHAGIHGLVAEISGLGLSEQEQVSVVFRVLAFTDLVEDARSDARLSRHLAVQDGNVQVSAQFLAAAARARVDFSSSGSFRYDLDSVAGALEH